MNMWYCMQFNFWDLSLKEQRKWDNMEEIPLEVFVKFDWVCCITSCFFFLEMSFTWRFIVPWMPVFLQALFRRLFKHEDIILRRIIMWWYLFDGSYLILLFILIAEVFRSRQNIKYLNLHNLLINFFKGVWTTKQKGE